MLWQIAKFILSPSISHNKARRMILFFKWCCHASLYAREHMSNIDKPVMCCAIIITTPSNSKKKNMDMISLMLARLMHLSLIWAIHWTIAQLQRHFNVLFIMIIAFVSLFQNWLADKQTMQFQLGRFSIRLWLSFGSTNIRN